MGQAILLIVAMFMGVLMMSIILSNADPLPLGPRLLILLVGAVSGAGVMWVLIRAFYLLTGM